jgi:hypothetical protein
MSIIDSQLVNIEIVTLPHQGRSRLMLTYQSQKYDLLQAFSTHKLEAAQQQWQRLMSLNNTTENLAEIDRYLLLREIGYYSLWALDRSLSISSGSLPQPDGRHPLKLELQQASLWLFQELWLQWQDLLGTRQLQVFAENLVAQTPPLQSRADLDRLLGLNPLATAKLAGWTDLDFNTFARQVYHLTQQKLGQQFGTKIASEIMQSMPELLQSTLVDTLGV